MPARSAPLRFGYHGSAEVPLAVLKAAGRDAADVDLVLYDIADPFALLRAGELDVMIAKFSAREPDLRYSAPLARDERVVVVGLGHELAGRDSVSVEEVAAYPVFRRPGSMPASVWDEVVPPVTPGGRPIRREFEMGTVPEMMELIASGVVVHLTVASLGDIAPATVRLVPVSDLPAAEVTLVYSPGAGPAVLDFVRDAQAQGSERIG